MKIIISFILLLIATFFISCGENSETLIIPDVESLKINESNVSIYSTDANNLTATVYYTDGSTADATSFVSWQSSDTTIANVSQGSVTVGSINGGDTNITVSYKSISSLSSPLKVIALSDYNLSMINADANTTGTYSLIATAIFENNVTKVIEKNIVWAVDNGAIVSGAGSLTQVQIVSTGDTNITATLFNDANLTKTIIYSAN